LFQGFLFFSTSEIHDSLTPNNLDLV
jgi:hypothetical protein